MMNTKDDQFLIWVSSGIIGVLIRDIYSIIAKFIGLAKFFVWQIGAEIFVKPDQAKMFLGSVLGFLTDFVTGGLMGVIFGLFIEWRGTKYPLIKGLGLGLLAWIFLFGILYHTLPQTATTAPQDNLSNLSAFIGHSIFGLAMAFAYLKLSKMSSKKWNRQS